LLSYTHSFFLPSFLTLPNHSLFFFFFLALLRLYFTLPYQAMQAVQSLSLDEVVTHTGAAPLFDDAAVRARLLPLLPEGQQTDADLRAVVRAPQFKATLRRLGGILSGPQYTSLLQSLGLPLPASGTPGVPGFLESVQAKADADKEKDGDNAGGGGGASSS
jgi:hypothetical protein